MSNELIQVVDCLSKSEVDKVLDLILVEDRQWEPTTVFGQVGCEVNKDIRSNTRYCASEESEEAKIMHEGMNAALLTYRDQLFNVNEQFCRYPVPGTYKTQCHREAIQVLKYDHAEHYNWHTDKATDKNVNEVNRDISVVLYLTDDFEGGRTAFTHRAFKPKAGQALIFPSVWCYPHRSEPITSGTKIVAVTWYHSVYDDYVS